MIVEDTIEVSTPKWGSVTFPTRGGDRGRSLQLREATPARLEHINMFQLREQYIGLLGAVRTRQQPWSKKATPEELQARINTLLEWVP
jgi:hypothetical protein